MKSLKVMSIVGLVWSTFGILCIAAFENSDPTAAAGWGFLVAIYAIALAIVALVQSGKHGQN